MIIIIPIEFSKFSRETELVKIGNSYTKCMLEVKQNLRKEYEKIKQTGKLIKNTPEQYLKSWCQPQEAKNSNNAQYDESNNISKWNNARVITDILRI